MSTRSTSEPRGAELLRQHGQILGQVSGLVDVIDEISADKPLGRVCNRELQLPVEMVLERHIARDDGFEIRLAVEIVRALTQGRPAATGEVGPEIRGCSLGENILVVRVEVAGRLGRFPR